MNNEILELVDKIEKKRGELLFLISDLDRLSGQSLLFYEVRSECNNLFTQEVPFIVKARHDRCSAINKLMMCNEILYKGTEDFKAIFYKYNRIYSHD